MCQWALEMAHSPPGPGPVATLPPRDPVTIGECRKLRLEGHPGYVRVGLRLHSAFSEVYCEGAVGVMSNQADVPSESRLNALNCISGRHAMCARRSLERKACVQPPLPAGQLRDAVARVGVLDAADDLVASRGRVLNRDARAGTIAATLVRAAEAAPAAGTNTREGRGNRYRGSCSVTRPLGRKARGDLTLTARL